MPNDDDDALIGMADAASIGFKIVEMADRVRKVHQMTPAGTKAKWSFEIDDIRFDVLVGISDTQD